MKRFHRRLQRKLRRHLKKHLGFLHVIRLYAGMPIGF